MIENQRIFLSTRKDLGVGGWGPENPYGVRILNMLEIIGRPLIGHEIRNNITISQCYVNLHFLERGEGVTAHLR